jgi:predicted Zn-ribbon and HTH transcriptional regulator
MALCYSTSENIETANTKTGPGSYREEVKNVRRAFTVANHQYILEMQKKEAKKKVVSKVDKLNRSWTFGGKRLACGMCVSCISLMKAFSRVKECGECGVCKAKPK